jgi:uncharacterized phage protein gp47/JayE
LPGAPFTLSRSWVSEAISLTPGETAHGLVSPVDDLVIGPGELPVLGAVTFVS